MIVEDAIRFVLHFREIVERLPLQLYNSCLIFCPQNSKTLSAFSTNLQTSVTIKKLALEDWPATILEFEIEDDSSQNSTVTAMAWESNTRQIACCDGEGSVHLYDALSGQRTHHFNLARWIPIEDVSPKNLQGFSTTSKLTYCRDLAPCIQSYRINSRFQKPAR